MAGSVEAGRRVSVVSDEELLRTIGEDLRSFYADMIQQPLPPKIEAALARIAELQGRMIHCRSVAGIATATGHEAFEHLAQATLGLVKSRGEIASCHGVLKETKQLVPGLRTTSFGEGDECPPPSGIQPLRIVA